MGSDDKKDDIDRELIRDLAALLTETDLSEIEIERDDFRVRVTRAIAPAHAAPAPVYQAAPAAVPASAEADRSAAGPSSTSAAGEAVRPAGAVPSPMVGTVYTAPEPGASPFVSVGDTVSEGQTLMIVEAMKHMNEVAAPRAGTIKTVLVEDGQAVEYGEPLLTIE